MPPIRRILCHTDVALAKVLCVESTVTDRTRLDLMRRFPALMLAALLGLAACQTDDIEAPEAGGFDPSIVDRQRSQCEENGGRWASGGESGRLVCYLVTKDANKTCSRAGDCEGLCLARSRSCAPLTPFFGCHEILGERGDIQTLCID